MFGWKKVDPYHVEVKNIESSFVGKVGVVTEVKDNSREGAPTTFNVDFGPEGKLKMGRHEFCRLPKK